MRSLLRPCVALFAVFTLDSNLQAELITFGTSGNEFTIDFVNIGNAGNAADTTGYGAVPYQYRVGKYEISENAILKATASGMANVAAGAWTGDQPAAKMSWYEAAAFVNWLNTSTGKQAAYNLTYTGSSWSMALWNSADAWTAGGTNLYRHKDAEYFLTSENEWYKAAYYNPGGSDYFLYPTGSDTAPTAVASGTSAGTAVYGGASGPAIVDSAGGLSPYGTMGQGGNVREWTESSFTGFNSSATANRAARGGIYDQSPATNLSSSARSSLSPGNTEKYTGFRVASADATPIPEPGTWAAAVLLAGAAGYSRWRKRKVS